MRKKSKPSRSPALNTWSEEEVYGHYCTVLHSTASLNTAEEHPVAEKSDVANPERVGLNNSSQDAQGKNNNADVNPNVGSVNQPAHYRIRKIGKEPRSVRDYLRIARTKFKTEPSQTLRRSGRNKGDGSSRTSQ
ncbi:uncharacterized protein LOC131063681 [Cryptomeria japonica]|uniref:uncharacterized protein LOC131063681 n=1 Tax=Cryptomeria japonica TaxID=3369 RepID=UPI0027D9D5D2|nr:uncharacterized protein LOC131063681 [Cryptomeria japonica]